MARVVRVVSDPDPYPGGACVHVRIRVYYFPHLQYYTQFNNAVLLFMSSIVSPDSAGHDTGPTIFSQALPEMPGNSVSPIRAPQDTPEILEWLHLPYHVVHMTTIIPCHRVSSLAVSSL